MRTAFVHDWLVSYRGGEKVLEALLELYPEAPIYTLFYDAKAMPESIRSRKIIFPKWLMLFRPLRKALLPFLPSIIESLNLSKYDLIISTSSSVAKGVVPAPNAKHICYLHSPMRYVWDQQEAYVGKYMKMPIVGRIIDYIASYLRRWDVDSSKRVDHFVVNSNFVKERVKHFYGREAHVVHPPIDLNLFLPRVSTKKDGYFLAAGALVAYKRFDLAIEACEKIGRPLVVAGSGPMERSLRKIAKSQTVFNIAPDHETLNKLMQGAEALVFPGVEDFGMIPIEAMASGTPVIAFRRGGALDYIQPGKTGDFFEEQTIASLSEALQRHSFSNYKTTDLIAYAQGFNKESFIRSMQKEIDIVLAKPKSKHE